MKTRTLIAAAAAAAVLLVCFVQAQEQHRGTIKGRVTDASSGASVPFQNVSIQGTRYGTTTDIDGRFMLRNLPEGSYVLQVTGIGYAPVSMRVDLGPDARAGDVSLLMKQREVALAEVQIVVEAQGRNADTPVSLQTLSAHRLQTAAGGMDDVARALSSLPGVAPMRVERNDLIVRGGAPSENLFMIDGFEFPTISHFAVQGAGTGSSSAIGTDLIERVSFSSGGFGARSGDKLSSVVALSLRDGTRDRHHASLALSATQFGITGEGPLFQAGSFLVSVRRSYLEPVFKAYDMSFAPVYWDVSVKAGAKAGPSDNIRILAVGTSDRMHLFNDTESKRETNADLVFGDQDMVTAGVAWEHYQDQWSASLTVSNTTGSFNYYQPAAAHRDLSTIESYENEASVSIDATVLVTETTEISGGMKTKFIRFRDNVDLQEAPWFLNVNGALSRIEKNADTSGMKHAGYVQLSQRIGSLVVNAGVRADYFSLIEHRLAAAPRLSVIWHASDEWEATASAGRYYQSPANAWLVNPSNMQLRHAGADHVVAGVSRMFGPDWKITIEGYQKSYFDYPVSIEAPCMTVFNSGSPGSNFKDFGLDSLTSRGRGSARGVELLVQKQMSDAPLSGMLSLSLSETNFTSLDGITRPADHDQRWIMNLALDYRSGNAWEVTGRFMLYTGHPYTDRRILNYGTLAQYAREYNRLRVGLNHMLDLRVTRRWEAGDAGIEVFLDVQNVYNKKPLDTPEIDSNTGAYKETAMVGIVPSLGIKVSL